MKRSTINQLLILTLQAILLAAWVPLFTAQAQAGVERRDTPDCIRASETPGFLADVPQAEFLAENTGEDSVTSVALKLPASTTIAQFVLLPIKYSLFQLTPCCQMRRFGSAILPERAPPASLR